MNRSIEITNHLDPTDEVKKTAGGAAVIIKVEHIVYADDLIALTARALDNGRKVRTQKDIVKLFTVFAENVSSDTEISINRFDDDVIKQATDLVTKVFGLKQ